MSKYDYIKKAQKEKWKVCVYGLGYLGKRLCFEIPKLFDLVPDYYSDGDSLKVDSIKIDNVKPIYKKNLLELNTSCLVFILVDDPYDLEIQKTLLANSNLYSITLRELVLMDEVICRFYGNEIYEKYKNLEEYSID